MHGNVRNVKVAVQAALLTVALGAVSVGGADDDDDDCSEGVECLVVTGIRVACKGTCIDPTNIIEEQREEMERRMRIEHDHLV